jgi:hypothetical protein
VTVNYGPYGSSLRDLRPAPSCAPSGFHRPGGIELHFPHTRVRGEVVAPAAVVGRCEHAQRGFRLPLTSYVVRSAATPSSSERGEHQLVAQLPHRQHPAHRVRRL